MDRTCELRRVLLASVVLSALTLAAFWPVVHNQFINFDDPTYITDNPQVNRGLSGSGIAWALKTGYAGNWHPLTWMSHMLDAQWFGLNPAGHHAVNLCLHAANAVLLFWWLGRVTGSFWRSLFVAAIFAVHPLRVESVAWASERKDVLSALFFLLTLCAYTAYAKRHGTRPALLYLLTLVLFACGLMSKPMLVTVPFVLLLLDYWPLRRLDLNQSKSIAGLVIEKLPYFGLSIAAALVTVWAQSQEGAVVPAGLPYDSRVANAILSYWRYLEMTFWPANLALFYPHPAWQHPRLRDWITWEVGLAAVVVAVISVLAFRWGRRKPYFAVGWFWYLGMLVPVIGLMQVAGQALADRYTYLPMIGVGIAGVWLIPESFAGSRSYPVALAAGALAVLATCSVLTWNQAGRWRDSLSIFGHTLAVTRNNATAHINYGAALEQKGELVSAMDHYRRSIQIDPSVEAHYNLGRCLAQEGKLDDALEQYTAALKIKPDFFLAHNNLGIVFHQQGKFDSAAAHYREAIRLQPRYAQAHYNLGKLFADSADFDSAANEYRLTLQLEPQHGPARMGLGVALSAQGNFQEALPLLRQTVQTLPQNSAAQLALGNALTDAGQPGEARAHLDEALRLAPDLVEQNLQAARTYVAQGAQLNAVARYSQIVRLAPRHVEAHQELGQLFAQAGNLTEAIRHFDSVIALQPTAPAFYQSALALNIAGQTDAAVKRYRQALEADPNSTLALNDLAWILATHPQAELRNGAEAVRLAEKACHESGDKEPRFCGTLDAAYAEVGRFDEAIATAQKTRQRALALGQSDIAEAAEKRLELYRAGKPYRQSNVEPAKTKEQP